MAGSKMMDLRSAHVVRIEGPKQEWTIECFDPGDDVAPACAVAIECVQCIGDGVVQEGLVHGVEHRVIDGRPQVAADGVCGLALGLTTEGGALAPGGWLTELAAVLGQGVCLVHPELGADGALIGGSPIRIEGGSESVASEQGQLELER